MSNRRFEMYEYRQALHRMRLGESNRTIAKSGLMGRRKAAELKRIAKAQGWLNKQAPLPDDAALLTHFDKKPNTPPNNPSSFLMRRRSNHGGKTISPALPSTRPWCANMILPEAIPVFDVICST